MILKISSRDYKFNFYQFENLVLKIEVTIYHIDAHRYFHIDHIGLITAQVLCGLCENPIVVYVVNSYKSGNLPASLAVKF